MAGNSWRWLCLFISLCITVGGCFPRDSYCEPVGVTAAFVKDSELRFLKAIATSIDTLCVAPPCLVINFSTLCNSPGGGMQPGWDGASDTIESLEIKYASDPPLIIDSDNSNAIHKSGGNEQPFNYLGQVVKLSSLDSVAYLANAVLTNGRNHSTIPLQEFDVPLFTGFDLTQLAFVLNSSDVALSKRQGELPNKIQVTLGKGTQLEADIYIQGSLLE